MTFRYALRQIWLVDLEVPPPKNSYVLCQQHADKLTPPWGWTLNEMRNQARLFGWGQTH